MRATASETTQRPASYSSLPLESLFVSFGLLSHVVVCVVLCRLIWSGD